MSDEPRIGSVSDHDHWGEPLADRLRKRTLTCCFCNEQCESLEALKTHSGACQEHPAVKDFAILSHNAERLLNAVDVGGRGLRMKGHLSYGPQRFVSALQTSMKPGGGEAYLEEVRQNYKDLQDIFDESNAKRLAAMEQQVAALTQQVRRHAEDWSSTDTHVRTVAKRFLAAEEVDGDANGVPPIEDVVDALSDHIDKVEQQVAALRTENERLRTSINLCSGPCRVPD